MGPSRAHLNQAVITDRRGRVTTVYRKPDQQAPSGRGIPPRPDLAPGAPAAAEAESAEQPREKLQRLMRAANGGRALSADKKLALSLFSDAQMGAMLDAWGCEGFPEFFSAAAATKKFTYQHLSMFAMLYTAGAFAHVERGSKKGTAARQVRAAQQLHSQLSAYSSDIGVYRERISQLPDQGPWEQQRVLAYAALFAAVREIAPKESPDSPLVELAFRDAADPAAVAELIRSTGQTDVPTLRGLLAGAPAAVADGYL